MQSKIFCGALAAAAITLYGCSTTDGPTTPAPATESIAELATAAGLNTLVTALTAADLASTFANSSAGPFTVFAPTDDAFTALNTALGIDIVGCLLEDTNKPLLTEVLQFHVHAGEVLSSALSNDMQVTTLLAGEDLTVTLSDAAVTINPGNATVIQPDALATNGVVHVIDAVLVPPTFAIPDSCQQPATQTIAELATSSGLNTLVAALDAAELASIFNDASAGPFTVFAPTDDAFTALNSALGQDIVGCLLKEANKLVLTEVLQFHVHAGEVLSSQLENNMQVDTLLSGGDLTVTINGTTVTINPGDATVVQADAKATNGVVHVINAVLVPKSFTPPDNCDSTVSIDI